MSEKIAKKIKGRFLICIWLTILFVALKVTGVIAWSWLWVLSPFLINDENLTRCRKRTHLGKNEIAS